MVIGFFIRSGLRGRPIFSSFVQDEETRGRMRETGKYDMVTEYLGGWRSRWVWRVYVMAGMKGRR